MTDFLDDGVYAYRRADGQIFRRPLRTNGLSVAQASWTAMNAEQRQVTRPDIIAQLSQSTEHYSLQFD